jgi:hypothetical protein
MFTGSQPLVAYKGSRPDLSRLKICENMPRDAAEALIEDVRFGAARRGYEGPFKLLGCLINGCESPTARASCRKANDANGGRTSDPLDELVWIVGEADGARLGRAPSRQARIAFVQTAAKKIRTLFRGGGDEVAILDAPGRPFWQRALFNVLKSLVPPPWLEQGTSRSTI